MSGQLWHSIRFPAGNWQSAFGPIQPHESNNPGVFQRVSCAGVGTSLHVVGIVNGQLWHTIRNPDGSWQPTFGLIESHEGNNPGAFSYVGCAGIGSELNVVGLTSSGQLWHTIRNADGSWQPTFGSVAAVSHADNPFSNVSCAAVENTLHIAALSGGGLCHTIRYASGNWQPEFDYYGPPGSPGIKEICCAGVGASLQVVGVSDEANELYHTIWSPGPVWQATWGLVDNVSAPPIMPNFSFNYVGGSAISGALHLVAQCAGGSVLPLATSLWHTIRMPDGTWQPTFDRVGSTLPSQTGVSVTSCAAVGTSLNVVIVD